MDDVFYSGLEILGDRSAPYEPRLSCGHGRGNIIPGFLFVISSRLFDPLEKAEKPKKLGHLP